MLLILRFLQMLRIYIHTEMKIRQDMLRVVNKSYKFLKMSQNCPRRFKLSCFRVGIKDGYINFNVMLFGATNTQTVYFMLVWMTKGA